MDRIQKLKEFLQSSPGDCFVRHALALELIKIGDDASAQQLFENILSDNPGYVGSYYHLARLYERNNNTPKAISVFEKGMNAAKQAGDQHAFNELRSAYEELVM